MAQYQDNVKAVAGLRKTYGGAWNATSPGYATRIRAQNKFRMGLGVAKYTTKIMRADMAAYGAGPFKYTRSLGYRHGFIGQQKMISIKKHSKSTEHRYLYLSDWMVTALRSEFGPLPDQSMHEKTSVGALIRELYTFLRQADIRELGGLFRELDTAKDPAAKAAVQEETDNHVACVIPIIVDIDASFDNAETTYLLARQFIEAGVCCIQIENQVSNEKRCGRQDGKVTVPHEGFLTKIHTIRYAFLELGIDDGIVVARTGSLGASPTRQIAVTNTPGNLGDQYSSFLDCEGLSADQLNNGNVVIKRDGKLLRPKRLPSNLFQFHADTGEARCVLDCITSLQNGADLPWIETGKPHIGQVNGMIKEIHKVVPNAKLVYDNSPPLDWTLNFRQQVYDAVKEAGGSVSAYERGQLVSAEYDDSELAKLADGKIHTFQADASCEVGIFHHLITLPTYRTAALSTDNLAKEYFGDRGMLGYVAGVQQKEIRQGIACVKHQDTSGSNIGDDHKEYLSGRAALKTAGKDNTMNQLY